MPQRTSASKKSGKASPRYTGTVATAASHAEAVASAIEHLAAAERHETFLQQAYTTGVAYGILLDAASADWRRRVRSDSDLGQMLMAALDITTSRERGRSLGALRWHGSSAPRNRRATSDDGPWCASCRTASSMVPCFSFRQAVAERLTPSEPRPFPERGRCTSCRTVKRASGGRWRRRTAS